MSATTTPTTPVFDTGCAVFPAPKLNMTIHEEDSERFRALPKAERKRRLDAFRKALGRAFADTSVAEYLGERRREAARNA